MNCDAGIVGGRALGRVLLPALARVADEAEVVGVLAAAPHASHQSTVRTSRGRISTILISPAGARQLVVCLGGNNALMQDGLLGMLADADALWSAVLGLDYPGVGASTGDPSCADDLVQAVVEVVDAFAQRFDSILLKGESLGGAVAVLAAARLRSRVRVRVWAARTFADLVSVVSSNSAARCALSSVACCAGWTMDAARAWAALPPTDRAVIHCRDDDVIPVSASLHAAVGGRPDALFRCFGEAAGHAGAAHNVPLSQLIDTLGQTAEEAWLAFARRPAPAWTDVVPDKPTITARCGDSSGGPWLLLAGVGAAAAATLAALLLV